MCRAQSHSTSSSSTPRSPAPTWPWRRPLLRCSSCSSASARGWSRQSPSLTRLRAPGLTPLPARPRHSNLVGFLYPAYMSFKAIESDDTSDDTLWCEPFPALRFLRPQPPPPAAARRRAAGCLRSVALLTCARLSRPQAHVLGGLRYLHFAGVLLQLHPLLVRPPAAGVAEPQGHRKA